MSNTFAWNRWSKVWTLTHAYALSQVAAIAPVGGGRIAEVRFAGNDVLAREGVAVLVAPVCTEEASTITCTGSAQDGAVITVRSAADRQTAVTVVVGSRTLYDGPIQDVLDQAARPTS